MLAVACESTLNPKAPSLCDAGLRLEVRAADGGASGNKSASDALELPLPVALRVMLGSSFCRAGERCLLPFLQRFPAPVKLLHFCLQNPKL